MTTIKEKIVQVSDQDRIEQARGYAEDVRENLDRQDHGQVNLIAPKMGGSMKTHSTNGRTFFAGKAMTGIHADFSDKKKLLFLGRDGQTLKTVGFNAEISTIALGDFNNDMLLDAYVVLANGAEFLYSAEIDRS